MDYNTPSSTDCNEVASGPQAVQVRICFLVYADKLCYKNLAALNSKG